MVGVVWGEGAGGGEKYDRARPADLWLFLWE